MDGWMDGWMDWDFASYSTVCQSYQNDGMVIMKVVVQLNPVYDWIHFHFKQVSNPGPLGSG